MDAAARDLLAERKRRLRRRAIGARAAQVDKDEVSATAVHKVLDLPAYRSAHTVMWYLHTRSELRTQRTIGAAAGGDKCIVVPYCTRDDDGANRLGLWRLHHLDELVVGTWSILEPPRARWGEPGKEAEPHQLDLIIVPGVGFDRRGGRLGNGQGYYDRLLARIRPDATLIGLCYEAQLFDEIPTATYDIAMDVVVTERTVYAGWNHRRTAAGRHEGLPD